MTKISQIEVTSVSYIIIFSNDYDMNNVEKQVSFFVWISVTWLLHSEQQDKTFGTMCHHTDVKPKKMYIEEILAIVMSYSK